MIDGFFCWISFRPPCSWFSSCRLSLSDTAHGKWGREDSSMCFLELSVVRGHLDWCHVKFCCRPDSKQWVRSAEHAGTFIYDPHISFIFLTSKKKKTLINSRSQQKRIIAHLWHYRIVSALLIDSSGSRESGSELALKTMDPDADGGCRNMRESWKMRMFQSEKLLPWCKFNRPTRKREQRLL